MQIRQKIQVNLQANLIRFAALLFNRMAQKYGGATTLNELLMLNYGFVRHSMGKAVTVTEAAIDLDMPKSSVSRILTGMRAKGFVRETIDPTDKRRRVFRLSRRYLDQGEEDIEKFLQWTSKPENSLI
jgi:DNA-binding MarR family transcriptional regulator